jgi:hypothetical protein
MPFYAKAGELRAQPKVPLPNNAVSKYGIDEHLEIKAFHIGGLS